jgi:hypothetical protein
MRSEKRDRAEKALACLHLSAPAAVAQAVGDDVRAALAEQDREIESLEGQLIGQRPLS